MPPQLYVVLPSPSLYTNTSNVPLSTSHSPVRQMPFVTLETVKCQSRGMPEGQTLLQVVPPRQEVMAELEPPDDAGGGGGGGGGPPLFEELDALDPLLPVEELAGGGGGGGGGGAPPTVDDALLLTLEILLAALLAGGGGGGGALAPGNEEQMTGLQPDGQQMPCAGSLPGPLQSFVQLHPHP